MDQQPATKQDLADLEQRLDARFSEVDARFDELREAIQGFGTRILTAIHGCMGTISIREDAAARKAAEFEDRLMVLERRVFEVEKRLNVPPGQAA
jgi:hypothetical protein